MLSYTYMEEVRSDLSGNLAKPIQRLYYGTDEKFTQHLDFIQSRVSTYISIKAIY